MKSTEKTLIEELILLLRALKPRRRWQLLLLLLLMLLSSISQMVSLGAIFPFLSATTNAQQMLDNTTLQPLLNFLAINSARQLVTAVAVVFMVAAVVANALRLVNLQVQVRLAAMIGSDVSSEVYHRALHQPYSFHLQHNTSDLLQMVTGDTQALTQQVLIPLLAFANDIVLVPALILTLVAIDGRIAIGTAFVFGFSYWAIYTLRRQMLRRNSRIMAESGRKRIKAVQEGMGGIRDVLLDHSQPYFESGYRKAETSYKRAFATNSVISQSPRYLMEAITLVGIGLLVLTLEQGESFTQMVPVLGTLALGAKQLLPAFQEAFGSLAKMQGARASLSRVLLGLARPMSRKINISQLSPLNFKEAIFLDDVWFRYGEDSEWVLQGVSLTIPVKTTVAFVGSTGSGKSTTADLILGLLQPQRGSILVDGLPMEGENTCRWQKTVAHVPQAIFLTDGTIAENIAFGLPPKEISLEQVKRAAKLAQINDFIEGLPAGYETYVGERGIRLSGGQRQRIGIARALYGEASVVVFDEATSALDNATEREVMAAIEGLSHQFTVILIAHRLTTVERCDHIFELSQGRVVTDGNYPELLANSASFRQMAGSNGWVHPG
jgi:ABC-type multidrug transport system fused ATPase/permease subunit